MGWREKLCELMKQAWVNQRWVARHSGIPSSTFNRWINGDGEPKPADCKALAELFNLSMEALFNDHEGTGKTAKSWKSRKWAGIKDLGKKKGRIFRWGQYGKRG